MKIIRDLSGQNTPIIVPFPVANSTSDLYKGVLVTKSSAAINGGITAPTANTVADIVGLTTEFYDYSVEGTYTQAITTSAFPEMLIDIRPNLLLEAELYEVGAGQKFAAEEAVGQTSIAITAIAADDDFNGMFMYDDGTEQIRFITDSANSGETITVAALTTVIAANVTCIFVPQRLSGQTSVYTQMTTADSGRKVLVDGLVNGYPWERIMDVHISPISAGKKMGKERMIPWKHDSCTTKAAVLSCQFVITDHVFKNN